MHTLRYLPERHLLAMLASILFLVGASAILGLLTWWLSPLPQAQEATTPRLGAEALQEKRPSLLSLLLPTPVPQLDQKTARETLDRALEALPAGGLVTASATGSENRTRGASAEERIAATLNLKKEPAGPVLIVGTEEGWILVVTEFLFPEGPPWSQSLGPPPQGSWENPFRIFLGERLVISITDSKDVRGRRAGSLQEIKVGYVAQLSDVSQYKENQEGPPVYTLGVFSAGILDLYWENSEAIARYQKARANY